MSEPAPRTPNAIQRLASRLADELGGYVEVQGLDGDLCVSERLTGQQKALVCDTFGLLNGIADGVITVGQPRIRDNLVSILTEVSDGQGKGASEQLTGAIASILSRASGAGLTADNQSLTNAVRGHVR